MKRDSKSVAYENRTKNAKCGGLETNRPRERISSLGGCVAVRRFVREARGYWRFQSAKTPRRMLVAAGRAEGEELYSNGLSQVCAATLRCDSKRFHAAATSIRHTPLLTTLTG